MPITKAQLKILRTEMQAALDKAGIANFKLEVAGMRFTSDEVTIKVEGKLKGVTTTTDRVFERKVAELGLRLVAANGSVLTGYVSRRPKYPFTYTTVRGAKYKGSISQIKAIFG